MEYFPLVQRFESALWISLVCHGQSGERFRKSLDWDFAVSHYRYQDQRHQLYIGDTRRLGELIAAQHASDRYQTVRTRCDQACRRLLAAGEEVGSAFDPGMPRAEAFELFDRLLQASMDAMPFVPSLVLIQNMLESDLREALADDLRLDPGSAEFGAFWLRAVIPSEQANFVPETRDVLRLGNAYREEGLALELALEELPASWRGTLAAHTEAYGWLGTFTFLNEPYSEQDILARVQRAAGQAGDGLADTLERTHREEQEARDAIAQLGTARARDLLETARAYMHLRFERIDVHFKAEVQTRAVQERLAALAGISRAQLVMLTYDELRAWALADAALPAVEELETRERDGIEYYVEEGGHRWHTAEPLRRVLDLDARAAARNGGISGSSACLGHVRGRIKHVTSVADMRDFAEGDVLLSPMTTPDVMYAIERASAIVTDEGGVLCHAAIISRELGKPCVTSCEHATRAFQDGDLVELDASAQDGVVRLIEEAAGG